METVNRNIHGLNKENWLQFTYLARRLGFTYSELFDELMRFYFEANQEKMKDLFQNLNIVVVPREGSLKVSPTCADDLNLVKQTMEKGGEYQKVGFQLDYLAKEYSSDSKHSKADVQAVADFISMARSWMKKKLMEG